MQQLQFWTTEQLKLVRNHIDAPGMQLAARATACCWSPTATSYIYNLSHHLFMLDSFDHDVHRSNSTQIVWFLNFNPSQYRRRRLDQWSCTGFNPKTVEGFLNVLRYPWLIRFCLLFSSVGDFWCPYVCTKETTLALFHLFILSLLVSHYIHPKFGLYHPMSTKKQYLPSIFIAGSHVLGWLRYSAIFTGCQPSNSQQLPTGVFFSTQNTHVWYDLVQDIWQKYHNHLAWPAHIHFCCCMLEFFPYNNQLISTA